MLRTAIHATFERRGTRLPDDVPFGLTDEFSEDLQKQALWQAFLRRNHLAAPDLPTVVAEIRAYFRTLSQ